MASGYGIGDVPRHCITTCIISKVTIPRVLQLQIKSNHYHTDPKMAWMFVFLLAAMQLTMVAVAQNQFKITPKVIAGSGVNQCPLQEEKRAALKEITNKVRNILQPYSECGDGLWYRVAYLNMSDPSQRCPSAWREYAFDGIRVCARPISSGASVLVHTTE